jgi:transposase
MTFHDSSTNIPDPEVVPKAKRRKFSAEYKRRILDEANSCTEPGQIGALLRREGLVPPVDLATAEGTRNS